jgi:hypothetical protein
MGNLTYDGHYQYPPYRAVTYKAEHQIYKFDTRVGYIIPTKSPNLQFIPFATAGYRFWKSEIDANQENYSNGYLGIGGKFDYAITHRLIISPSIDVGRTILAHVRMVNNFFGFAQPLGNSFYWRAGIEINYIINNIWSIGLSSSYMTFKFGKSNTQNLAFEPDSITKELTYGIHISYLY